MTTDLEDRLRAALAHRAEHTTPGEPDLTRVVPAGRRLASPRAWLVAAAVLVALVAGLVVFERVRVGDHDEPPATPVTGDPMAIDLDGLRTGPAPALPTDYLIVDTTAAMPDGWTVSDVVGFSTQDFDGTELGYQYRATVHAPNGVEHYLMLMSTTGGDAGTPAGATFDVDGRPAVYENGMLQWYPDDEHSVAISGTSGDDAFAAAQVLRWTTGALPIERIDGVPERSDDTRLAGMLDGIAWIADVDPGPLRDINVVIGTNGGGGMENDRDSQPDDSPQVGIADGRASAPGHGVITMGFAPPEVVAVRVVSGATTIATVPTYQRPAESFFAVPVPAGLAVTELAFVDANGAIVATLPDESGASESTSVG